MQVGGVHIRITQDLAFRQDRQSRQEGTFAAVYNSIEYGSTLSSQGTCSRPQ